MKIQLIRNATMKIDYFGKTIVCDPMFSSKGEIRSFAGIEPNPTKELTIFVEEILAGVDGVVVSHLHPDHFDEKAQQLIPKDLPLFCQPEDRATVGDIGFSEVHAVEPESVWGGINITRTSGQHGKGKILEMMGTVSGFVLQAEGEPTLYWAGDTILYAEVEEVIKKFQPDVIVTHSGGATLPGHEPIIMDGAQTVALAKAAPKSQVVAIHMESLHHCVVTRDSLRALADAAGISQQIMIPNDGETISF